MVTTILILGATIFFGRILYGLSAGIGPPTAFSPKFVNMGPIISSVTNVSFFDFCPFYQFISFLQKRIERFCLIHFIRYLFAFGTNAKPLKNGN